MFLSVFEELELSGRLLQFLTVFVKLNVQLHGLRNLRVKLRADTDICSVSDPKQPADITECSFACLKGCV